MAAYCTFPIPNELYNRIMKAAESIEKGSSNQQQQAASMIEVLLEQIDIGVDYYFLRIPQELNVGKLGMKIVGMGIKTMKGGMHMIIHKVLKNLSDEHLQTLVRLEKEMVFQIDTSNIVKKAAS